MCWNLLVIGVLTVLFIHVCVFVGACWANPITRACGHLALWLKVFCALQLLKKGARLSSKGRKEHRTKGGRKKKKKHVLSVTARTQYFAIFLRLSLFTRSYRWNAFKDNKEIKITFRNPHQGERQDFKVNKAVQVSTVSHSLLLLLLSLLRIWLTLNFLDAHVKIFWCFPEDSFSILRSAVMETEYITG